MKTYLVRIAMVIVLLAGAASAQSAPQLINYQGRITDSLGQPPADGSTVDLTFRFYSAATGGTIYLTVIQEDVVISGGLFNLLIGSGTVSNGAETSLADVFKNHGEVWMGVRADNEAEMTPRSRIASVPYSLACDTARTVDLGPIARFMNEQDYDGDGFRKPIFYGDDCDDSNEFIYPEAPEVCDGVDNQCPGDIGYGELDEGCGACEDLDADGRGTGCAAGPDCDDLDMNNWDSCDTCIDVDCDGFFIGCDAYVTIDGPDCDDLDLNTYPGASELCDLIDNQCPGDPGYGQIDENCSLPFMWSITGLDPEDGLTGSAGIAGDAPFTIIATAVETFAPWYGYDSPWEDAIKLGYWDYLFPYQGRTPISLPPFAVLLVIYPGFGTTYDLSTLPDADRMIRMKDDNGNILDLKLPAITIPASEALFLYVGSDGSSYYAYDDSGTHTYDIFDQYPPYMLDPPTAFANPPAASW